MQAPLCSAIGVKTCNRLCDNLTHSIVVVDLRYVKKTFASGLPLYVLLNFGQIAVLRLLVDEPNAMVSKSWVEDAAAFNNVAEPLIAFGARDRRTFSARGVGLQLVE